MSVTIGIDPGITGGLVVIGDDGKLYDSARTPSYAVGKGSKRAFDIPGMVELIDRWEPSDTTCAIELVGTMPRDGRVGAFNFGRGFGIWLGILAALKVPYFEVPPQRWQSKMLAGLPRGPHTKTSAVTRCKALFPTLPLKVKADWGMADAALIAEYVRTTRTNKT